MTTAEPVSTNVEVRNVTAVIKASPDLIRTEKLNGITYLVVPAIPIVEGVHNGEFVAYEEIAVFPDAWDGRPLPIDHPSKDGVPVTANSPDIMEQSVVGILFNVQARDDIRGISGELWIDTAKAVTVPGGEEVINRINAGDPLEVSTAYNTFVDKTPGEFKNKYGEVEKFRGSQHGLRPDHLALLPFSIGACNWRDGCGAPRINGEQMCKQHVHAVDSTIVNSSSPEESSVQTVNDLKTNGKQLGIVLASAIVANEGTDSGATMKSRLATAANIAPAKLDEIIAGSVDFIPRHWINIFAAVLDVDPYEMFMACSNDSTNMRYSMNADGKLELTDKIISATNVKDVSKPDTNEDTTVKKPCGSCEKTLTEKIQGVVANALKALGIEKVESSTTNEDKLMDQKLTVDKLIASNANKFTEANREWLMTLNADQLSLFDAGEEEKKEKEAVKATEVTNAAVEPKQEPVVATITADMIYAALGLSPADFQIVKTNAETVKAARIARVDAVAAIEGCPYSKAELTALSDEVLEKTAKLLESEAPYRVAVGQRSNTKNTVPAPPAILLAKVGGEGK